MINVSFYTPAHNRTRMHAYAFIKHGDRHWNTHVCRDVQICTQTHFLRGTCVHRHIQALHIMQWVWKWWNYTYLLLRHDASNNRNYILQRERTQWLLNKEPEKGGPELNWDAIPTFSWTVWDEQKQSQLPSPRPGSEPRTVKYEADVWSQRCNSRLPALHPLTMKY